MIIEVDLTQVPPTSVLSDADNFRDFKLVARGEHAFIPRGALVELAGARGQSQEWLEQLDQMIGYAQSKGWTDSSGAVRAHIERAVAHA